MPLHADGQSKFRAFIGEVISGIVEPIGAMVTVLAADLIVPILPYLLSAAAGAMMYVVVEELVPEMSAGEHSNLGVIAFFAGFTLMLALDTVMSLELRVKNYF